VLPVAIHHDGSLTKNVAAFWKVAGILRREKFDIVHTHTSVAAAIGRVASKLVGGGRTIHMLHNYGSHDHVPALRRKVYLWTERALDRFTDLYIAGSEAMLDRGVQTRIFGRHKATHVYNGIDVAWFDREAAGCVGSIRDELGIAAEVPVVGFLGRLERQKGCETLVRAAPLLLKQQPQTRFIIAGDGSLSDELMRLSKQLDVAHSFHFLGWRSDIVRQLKGFDLLAVPSLWEPFGLSAAEAMCLRVPVVASRVDGLAEVVEDGVSGFLVPPDNPQALASAMQRVIDAPRLRASMGNAGRIRVNERFTVTRMTAAHEKLYYDIHRGRSAEAK
jgi:glycosyltransferase involved in cell wall biosynthesis